MKRSTTIFIIMLSLMMGLGIIGCSSEEEEEDKKMIGIILQNETGDSIYVAKSYTNSTDVFGYFGYYDYGTMPAEIASGGHMGETTDPLMIPAGIFHSLWGIGDAANAEDYENCYNLNAESTYYVEFQSADTVEVEDINTSAILTPLTTCPAFP